MIDTFFKNVMKFFSKYKYYFLALFFLFQYLLFRQYIHREILPIYPTAHDQVNYLNQSFQIYKTLQVLDLQQMLKIVSTFHTGIFLQLITAIFYLFFGPSREIALTVNFLFLIFAELNIFRFTKIIFGRTLHFLYLSAFFILPNSIYYIIGGIVDFRLDFASVCINLALLLELTIYFLNRKKYSFSYFLILLVLLFYTRENQIFVYTISFLFIFLFLFLAKKFVQIRELLFCLLIAFILVSPYTVSNIKNLYNYYYVGQISSEPEYRKAESNTQNSFDSLLYYPKSIVQHHLTINRFYFLIINIITLITLIILGKKNNKNIFIPAIASLIVSVTFLSIYTWYAQKSPVVGINILTPITVFLYILYYKNSSEKLDKKNVILIVFVFLISISIYFKEFNRSLSFSKNKKYQNVNSFMYFLINKVEDYKYKRPIISTFYNSEISDRLSTYFHSYSKNELIEYTQVLGNSMGSNLGPSNIKRAQDEVKKSDIIFYNVGNWPIDWIPFNKDYKKLRDSSENIINKYFCKEGKVYNLPFGAVQLFFKPNAIAESSGDWLISGSEININSNEICISKFKKITLKGLNNRNDTSSLLINYDLYSDNKYLDKGNVEVIMNKDIYQLTIPLSSSLGVISNKIIISSNNVLVPCKINKTSDCRSLLLWAPNSIIIE